MPTALDRMRMLLCFQAVIGLQVAALSLSVPYVLSGGAVLLDARHVPEFLFGVALVPGSVAMAVALAVRRPLVRGVVVGTEVAIFLVFNVVTVIAGIPEWERVGFLPDIVSGLLIGCCIGCAIGLLAAPQARAWFSGPPGSPS